MDKIGLVDNIYNTVVSIDLGRKGFATKGKEQEGRIFYEIGIAEAMVLFQEAQASFNPEIIIFVEYTFLSQELQICNETDNESISSLTQAVQSFDDAFLALQVVEKNAFYQEANKTRLLNSLRYPGIDPIEKTLLKQRHTNLSATQGGYIDKQKKAIGS